MVMMDAPIDYENIVKNLMDLIPDILAVAFVEGSNNIVYTTNNWDISGTISTISSGWSMQKLPAITVAGVKYITLQLEVDTLVATSVTGEGHIVGFKDDDRKIITYISPEGDRKAAIVELSRLILSLSHKGPYLNAETTLTPKYSLNEAAPKVSFVNPELEQEVKDFLIWMKDENGLQGYLNYYLQTNDTKILSELAKIYLEFREIFGV